MKLYKVLGPARQSCHGGTHVWEPGVWYTVTGKLKPCVRGFHLCRAQDLLSWIKPDVWHAEVRGAQITAANKVVARSARITTKTALDAVSLRLFAADCAERALSRSANPDPRNIAAIKTARLFAAGLATEEERRAAAAAAAAAAYAAAAAAAYADYAADAAYAAYAAVAYAAAVYVAAAAYAVYVAAAARKAERAWQTRRLLQYLNGTVDIERIIQAAL